MFATLDEQMKHDDVVATTPKQRMIKWMAIVVTAVVLFGALFLGIHLLA